MAEAVRRAVADAGLSVQSRRPDSIRVVDLLSWRYRDPARFVAAALRGDAPGDGDVDERREQPADRSSTARAGEIQRGEVDLAVLTGAEAWRTRMRARNAGAELPWTVVPETVVPDRIVGQAAADEPPRRRSPAASSMPVQMYPIFETALRAAARRDVRGPPGADQRTVGRVLRRRRGNPYAWAAQPARPRRSARRARPTGMIGLPIRSLMNSNNDVDQGAAVLMCSVGKARSLGVPEDRWIFVHAGTDCHEHTVRLAPLDVRRDPGDRARRASGARTGRGRHRRHRARSICTRASPRPCSSARASLGLVARPAADPHRRAVVRRRAVEQLRDARHRHHGRPTSAVAPGELGLVWANGGYVTKHAFGVYSTRPPSRRGSAVRSPAGRDRRPPPRGARARGPKRPGR